MVKSEMEIKEYQCDVLIVGGGAAGLRAALSAYKTQPQAKIILVTKGSLGRSGVSANAHSDRMSFHAPGTRRPR